MDLATLAQLAEKDGLLRHSAAMWWMYLQHRLGQDVPNPQPSTVTRSGGTITVVIPRRNDLTLTNDPAMYAGIGVDEWMGFEVEGGGSITGITTTHNSGDVTLTIATTGTVTAIRHCAQQQNVTTAGDGYPARRTAWFFDTGQESVCVPDENIRIYLLPFRVVF